MEQPNYWQQAQRNRLSRRRLLKGAAAGATGLAAAALVGCGDDEPASPGTSPGSTGASPGATGAVAYPRPPEYSKLAAQKLLYDFHWSQIGPQVQALGTPRLGGVFAPTGLNPPASFHPAEDVIGVSGQIVGHPLTHATLVSNDWDYKKNPDLTPATTKYSLSQSFETPDASTFIFKLRPGVAFHNIAPANGAPMTVEDVRATYDLFKRSRFHAQNFSMIKDITEPEAGTIRITTSEPAAQMLGALRANQYGVLNAKHIEEGDAALRAKSIGTGPFVATKGIPNRVRVYKKNPNWWYPKDQFGNQLPYLDGVVHQAIVDPAAAVAALRTSQTDYMRPTSVDQFESLRKELDMWGQVGVGPCACVSYVLGMSNRDPLWKDPRVRRAVSMAIDRQQIIDIIFGGAGTAKDWIPYYYRNLSWPDTWEKMGEWFKFDPQAARTLLQQAGFQTTGKVPLYSLGSSGGATTGSAAPSQAMAEAIMPMLKNIGIEVELKLLDSQGVNREAYGGQWTGLFILNESSYGLDADIAVQNGWSKSGRNAMGINDPKVDELFQKQRATAKNEDRISIWNELENYVNRDQLLRGPQLPGLFNFGIWRKYMHNIIESSTWYMNGGNMMSLSEAWMDDRVPSRNIDSY